MKFHETGMREVFRYTVNYNFAILILLCLCFYESVCNPLDHLNTNTKVENIADDLLPEFSPASSPEPLLPFIAPSPLTPFTNSTVPKLSGLCTLNFSSVESMITTTATDCVAVFAPYLANVVCCPQLEATLLILIGQSSKETNNLALNNTLSKYCLEDFEQILAGQGANDSLQEICSIRSSNLTEGSCPIKDVTEFEDAVDSLNLLESCSKLELNECCEQVCQNSISEAAKKLALKAYDLSGIEGHDGHMTRVTDCKSVVLRWLARKLDPSHATKVLRGLSNCNINKVCPLILPNVEPVSKGCGKNISNETACCNAMANYVSHLQRQSFTTNLQALDCAASLGIKLQIKNISRNVYNLCRISLKDFSLQVGPKESGCLLPSLPSDVTFDKFSGVSFLCDLNDNIPAPWPSLSQLPNSSCNKTIKLPALPAAASGQNGLYDKDNMFILHVATSLVLAMLV